MWNRRPGAFPGSHEPRKAPTPLCWRASSSPNRSHGACPRADRRSDPGGGKRASRLAEDRGGATAVEFAIIAPVFFGMLFGAFQLGWALHCNQSVDWAVQTVTRQLVGTPSLTQAQLQSSVQSQLTGVADPSQVTVSLTEDPAGSSPRLAHVSASYVHTIQVPFVSSLNYTYNTSSTMTLNP